jgi:hypothetical protein
LLKVDVESIEAGAPEPTQMNHPSVRIVKRCRVQAAGSPLSPAGASDQTGVFEHLQVTRDRGKTNFERLGELGNGCISISQALQNPSAGGIGQG